MTGGGNVLAVGIGLAVPTLEASFPMLLPRLSPVLRAKHF